MKKIALMFVLLIALCGITEAQGSCACTTTPFKPDPPCWNTCTLGLLSSVGLDALVNVLGIREDVARRIIGWEKRNAAASFEDYQDILTPEELRHVKRQVNSLKDAELEGLTVGADSSPATLLPQTITIEPPAGATITEGTAMAGSIQRKKGVFKAGAGSPVAGNINGGGKMARIGSRDRRASRKMPALAVKPLGVTAYYYYKDAQGEWRWRLRAAAGRTIADSSAGYKTKRECLADITRVKKTAKAPVKME
jgi:uncharacterized protein YegP (UPF0339 family)